MQNQWTRIYPAVFRWEIGQKEKLSPQDLLGSELKKEKMEGMAERELPFQMKKLTGEIRKDGAIVRFPSCEGERYYGLGLQLHSFMQNGKRKRLTTNADAVSDIGDSHAPVPFWVSSEGYAVLVDSAATVEVDFGCSMPLQKNRMTEESGLAGASTEELYKEQSRSGEVTVYIKGSGHICLYCFAADSIKNAVELYNLFSGGGCLPPLWGLGNLYRCYTKSDQEWAETLVKQMAEDKMPFSMVGLEPGWHSKAYSCSFTWSEERFPEPDRLLKLAADNGMQVNLWEQAYVHPTAPFYEEICPYSGDYEVWEGAVPDFAVKEAREIYGKHQEKLIAQGVGAVKLDECDGADYTGNWYFPDYAQFPSGFNGVEEKNLYGAMVIRVIQDSFKKADKRTFSEVRANYSHGAPMPYVLYSDLYSHRIFVRALCNSGFSGLLWCPEVRQCKSEYELLRRVQTTVFSPMSQIDGWMIPNPPWKQYNVDKNRAGELLPDDTLQNKVRELLEIRNQLVPYLYTAFCRYEQDGTPPFRPLVMDFPEDAGVWEIDDEYMMGDALLVAPMIADVPEEERGRRNVYLPEGKWYDFWTNECFEGGKTYLMETENIPVFVKENHLLPLAVETAAPDGASVFHLEVRSYGENPEPFLLVEDDGESFRYMEGEQKQCLLEKKDGKFTITPESDRYKLA